MFVLVCFIASASLQKRGNRPQWLCKHQLLQPQGSWWVSAVLCMNVSESSILKTGTHHIAKAATTLILCKQCLYVTYRLRMSGQNLRFRCLRLAVGRWTVWLCSVFRGQGWSTDMRAGILALPTWELLEKILSVSEKHFVKCDRREQEGEMRTQFLLCTQTETNS